MSKANQTFRQNDEAVSPVIGVILMVAITVVLAAVVFVLVSNLGGDSNTAPAISWNKNESQDRLTVVTASSNADWANLEIDGVATAADDGAAMTYSWELNADANLASDDVANADDPAVISATADPIRASDFLSFCGAEAGSLEITITDPSANQVVKTESFSVVACVA